MHSHKDRETRLSCVGLPHIFISDSSTNLRWLSTLSIIEPRADFELDSIVAPHKNGSAHGRTAASALLMTNDGRFSIFKLLDFKKHVASLVLIRWVWVLDHNAFATSAGNSVQFLSHMLHRCHLYVLDQLKESWVWVLFMKLVESFLDLFKALFEGALHIGCIKDHVLDVFPLLVLILSSHDAHDLLEIWSLAPKLAI